MVHVEEAGQALLCVQIARDAGADGVFLISHVLPGDALIEIYAKAREEHPDWWIGLNLLGLWPTYAVEAAPAGVSGLWTDDAQIDESMLGQPIASEIFDGLKQRDGRAIYFGGVAFKYQREVLDFEAAAAKAVPLMDVVTTTGPGTGKPADVAKVRRMRRAMGNAPLALASGVTPQNVRRYMPYVDCFLVASSITDDNEVLIPDRVRELLAAMGRS